MHPNKHLIETFYSAFQIRDAAAMCACYHPDVVFSDPAFGELQGAQAAAMWHMLCKSGGDLEITFDKVEATDTAGSAHWEARYTFSKKRRPVHNVIEAAFLFQDGQIIRHADTFSLWRWASMALGPVGLLLGWTPMVQSRIRKDVGHRLETFIKEG